METVLCNMCRIVKVHYLDVDFKKDNWWKRATWTSKQQNDFIDWLADYMHKIPKAQVELLGTRYAKKKQCWKEAMFFTMNHGWKVNDN